MDLIQYFPSIQAKTSTHQFKDVHEKYFFGGCRNAVYKLELKKTSMWSLITKVLICAY